MHFWNFLNLGWAIYTLIEVETPLEEQSWVNQFGTVQYRKLSNFCLSQNGSTFYKDMKSVRI